MRYGTPNQWAEYFVREEDVLISETSVRNKLRKAKKVGIDGRSRVDEVLKRTFYSEADAREVCADLLQRFPQADENGFFEIDGEIYGTLTAFGKHLKIISSSALKHRLDKENVKGVKGRVSKARGIHLFYPKSFVLRICADLLQGLSQANENGAIERNGEIYRTVYNWFNILQISAKRPNQQLKNMREKSIKGRAISGRVHIFYPESVIRQTYSHLLLQDPYQANENGFFKKDGIRYGTINAFVKEIDIAHDVISSRLKKEKIKPIRSKDRRGHIFDFYSEPDVLRVCADFIQGIPQADENGLFEKNGERYGNVNAWTRELQLPRVAARHKFQNIKASSIKGISARGRVLNFHPESAVLKACADLLEDMPQADTDGFFGVGGVRYGTITAMGRELPISHETIKRRIDNAKHPVASVKGKDQTGHIVDFYPEPIIREICSDLIEDIPRAGKDSFFEKNGVRYGTIKALEEELPISNPSIKRRITDNHIAPTKGKTVMGRICDFYPEPDVRRVCSDLLEDIPQANEDGFFEKDGIIYGTAKSWTRRLFISEPSITSRIVKHSVAPKKGKDKGGRICTFYPEPAVREVCADILAKKSKK